jgi:hypothetical protein
VKPKAQNVFDFRLGSKRELDKHDDMGEMKASTIPRGFFRHEGDLVFARRFRFSQPCSAKHLYAYLAIWPSMQARVLPPA